MVGYSSYEFIFRTKLVVGDTNDLQPRIIFGLKCIGLCSFPFPVIPKLEHIKCNINTLGNVCSFTAFLALTTPALHAEIL